MNAARIKQIEQQLDALTKEYFELINPTTDEIDIVVDCYQENIEDESECLIDDGSWIGRLYLAGAAMDHREDDEDFAG